MRLRSFLTPKIFQTAFFFTLCVIEYLATTTRHIVIVENMWDKSNHFLAFMTLFVLLSFAYQKLTTWQKVGLLFLYGIQIEIVQSFIPGRFFSLLDVVADMVGVGIGYILYRVLQGYISTPSQNSS